MTPRWFYVLLYLLGSCTVALGQQQAACNGSGGWAWVFNNTAPTDNYVLTYDASTDCAYWEAGGSGSGDVTGPALSIDRAIATWNGTGGDTLRSTGVTVSSDGDVVLESGDRVKASEFEVYESDSHDTCSAGEYFIFADTSETKLKKCQNGTASDLDTTGGTPAFSDITTGTNTTATMTVGTGASLTTSGSGTIAATTAGALAANGANCTAGSFPLGVNAAGAVESCDDDITGNAATATALAANGSNCSAGQAPRGVNASGAAEDCTAYVTGAVTDGGLQAVSGQLALQECGDDELLRYVDTAEWECTSGFEVDDNGTASAFKINVNAGAAEIDNAGRASFEDVTIGTPGSSGLGVLSIEGTAGSDSAGPHVVGYVSTDTTYPVYHLYAQGHDDLGLWFDAADTFSGAVSTDAGSNFGLVKQGDELTLIANGGTTAGSTFSGNDALVVAPSGAMTVPVSLAPTGGGTITATTFASNPANCSAGQFPLGITATGAAESCSTSLSGNASTATALAANGTNCSAGQAARGVDASGNAEDCFTPTAGSVDFDDVGTGTNTTATMTVGTGSSLTTSGSGTITATTATALAANGGNCSAGQAPRGVDASGAVENCTSYLTGALTGAGLAVASGQVLVRECDTGEILRDGGLLTWDCSDGFTVDASGNTVAETLQVGAAPAAARGVLTIEGPANNNDGAHFASFIATDTTYPAVHLWAMDHDLTGLWFDAYETTTGTVSSDAGSNFGFVKDADEFLLIANAGTSAGSSFSGDVAFRVQADGDVDFDQGVYIGNSGGAAARITDVLRGSKTHDFASILALSHDSTTVTVTGAADGDVCQVGYTNAAYDIYVDYACHVSASDTVTITARNMRASARDPGSGTFTVLVFKSS